MISIGPRAAPLSPYDLATRFGRRQTTLGEALGETVAQAFDTGTTLGFAVDQVRTPTSLATIYGRYGEDVLALHEDVYDAPQHQRRITREQYEASPHFRAEIPYRFDMTPELAEHLAKDFDARRYRDSVIARYQGGLGGQAALFGASLLAQATDPVNYIPFVAPARRTAMLGKLGVVAGHSAAGAADAALGTATFHLATTPDRIARGEDIGLDDIALEVAMGAGIGSVFGGVGGFLTRRDAARALGRDGLEATLDAMELARAQHDAGEPVDVSGVIRGSALNAEVRARLERGRAARAANENAALQRFDAANGGQPGRIATEGNAARALAQDGAESSGQARIVDAANLTRAPQAREAANTQALTGSPANQGARPGEAPLGVEAVTEGRAGDAANENRARPERRDAANDAVEFIPKFPSGFLDADSPNFLNFDKLDFDQVAGGDRVYGQRAGANQNIKADFPGSLANQGQGRLSFAPLQPNGGIGNNRISAANDQPGDLRLTAANDAGASADPSAPTPAKAAGAERSSGEAVAEQAGPGERALDAEAAEFETLLKDGHLDASASRLADEASAEADEVEGWADAFEALATCVVRFGKGGAS